MSNLPEQTSPGLVYLVTSIGVKSPSPFVFGILVDDKTHGDLLAWMNNGHAIDS